jgi:competence protein ComEC
MKNKTIILKIFKENFLNILFFILAILFVLGGKYNYTNRPMIVFFDIGQGDSILIQQGNYQVLVDGGPGDEIIFSLPKYMPWYDNKIETVVLTHPHADHIDGIMSVLQNYEVERILYNPIEYQNSAYEYLIENYKDILVSVKSGDTFGYEDIFFTVLYPFETNDKQEENINNESVVLLARIADKKILLMGDSEQEVEEKLLQEDIRDVYVLKIGHHCSRTSTSQMFLTSVSPEVAICSVGMNNKFGHPHYETIEKLKNANVQYLITYEEGDIRFKF